MHFSSKNIFSQIFFLFLTSWISESKVKVSVCETIERNFSSFCTSSKPGAKQRENALEIPSFSVTMYADFTKIYIKSDYFTK